MIVRELVVAAAAAVGRIRHRCQRGDVLPTVAAAALNVAALPTRTAAAAAIAADYPDLFLLPLLHPDQFRLRIPTPYLPTTKALPEHRRCHHRQSSREETTQRRTQMDPWPHRRHLHPWTYHCFRDLHYPTPPSPLLPPPPPTRHHKHLVRQRPQSQQWH